jgi:acetyltransferase-like isoleucine patch superfamily enzyme
MRALRRGSSELRWGAAKARPRLAGHRVRFGERVHLSLGATLVTHRTPGEFIEIGDRCEIHHGALLATHGGSIRLGERCSVNAYSILYGHGGLEIGRFVRIAPHCIVVPMNHEFADTSRPIMEQGLRCEGIVIEDDVWIGAHSVVLDGCTVGRGAVIAAGSIVTRDVPRNAVVAGSPARVVKHRGGRA